jgi:hypothetical protein
MPYSADGKEPAAAVLHPELSDCRDLAGGSGRSMGRIWPWRVGGDHELPRQTGKRVPRRSCHNPSVLSLFSLLRKRLLSSLIHTGIVFLYVARRLPQFRVGRLHPGSSSYDYSAN